jgi:hypothetical protein
MPDLASAPQEAILPFLTISGPRPNPQSPLRLLMLATPK